MIKIKPHSVVDVITNSSTVIYTYSDNCVTPIKEMINEFIKVFMPDSDKTADDMFFIGVFCDVDRYFEYDYDETPEAIAVINDLPYEEQGAAFDKLLLSILKGETKRPDWMEEVEGYEDYSGYAYETTLHIETKDAKYNKIAGLIHKTLYSTDHEASYD